MKKTVKAMILFIPVAFLLSCASMPGRQDSEITAEKNTAAKVIPINNQLPKELLSLQTDLKKRTFGMRWEKQKAKTIPQTQIPRKNGARKEISARNGALQKFQKTQKLHL